MAGSSPVGSTKSQNSACAGFCDLVEAGDMFFHQKKQARQGRGNSRLTKRELSLTTKISAKADFFVTLNKVVLRLYVRTRTDLRSTTTAVVVANLRPRFSLVTTNENLGRVLP